MARYVIDDINMSELSKESFNEFLEITRSGAKFIDIYVRKDGKDYEFQADFLKYAVKEAQSAELLTLQDRYNAQEKKLEKAKEALEYLLEAKQEKDTVSKTEKYLSLKTIGWDKAREVMAKLKAEDA